MIEGWQGTAFNQDPHSPNEIHGDELAQEYGFQGGLVPGVTVSAYLAHPGVQYWGLDFLSRGHLHAKVLSPLYDGEVFQVDVLEQSSSSYTAELTRPDGTLSARATAQLIDTPPTPPKRRGDAFAPKGFDGLPANRESCEILRERGCVAVPFYWGDDNIMRTYLRQAEAMPELLRGSGAYANMGFILAISNWAAADNLRMNPWIHLETHSQNYRPIAPDTRITAEMALVDLFEKRGHQFFDADFHLFDDKDDGCLCTIRLRAIYQLRAPSG